jgi:ribosomal-protein-alanine N-acetyltransferase
LFAEAARREDAAALAALEADGSRLWSEGDFARAVDSRASVLLVLRAGGRGAPPGSGVVGYCAFRVVADEMELLGLAVSPSARGRGHGRWLLGRALALARGRGARTAFLEVRPSNAAARGLYAAHGFAERGRRRGYYRDPPEDALLLARDLG